MLSGGSGGSSSSSSSSSSSNGSSSVFLYQFVHVTAAARMVDRSLGVFHGSELIYLFDKEVALWTRDERALARTFESLWMSFAAHGRPVLTAPTTATTTAAGGIGAVSAVGSWPAYDNGTDQNLRIDVHNITVDSGLKKSVCDFWATIAPHAEPPERPSRS